MTFNDISIPLLFKANIFIDWLNVKANGGQGLDFFKLLETIRSKGGNIVRANIYLPAPEPNQQQFYDVIKKAGFKLVEIPPKGNSVNCDALMAVEMVTQSNDVDAVYLLSNDVDFTPAVSYLQSIGKRVLLIHTDKPSNVLRQSVDEWRHIEQLGLIREKNDKM